MGSMNKTTITYLDASDVIDALAQPKAPRYGRDSQGYGRKIPTRYLVRTRQTGKRWLRLYVACYSNAATEYLSTKENPFWCASRAADRIRDLAQDRERKARWLGVSASSAAARPAGVSA